ncbi:helix-turn-helix domain-containing protein [Fructilactobacillus sp. Tb1]|uniref:helix-turn-helix domain-containing protein n=1 Tax=Fructilactobacillus sp. Tb1 TaxID=3422304 RepID=UPI003D2B20A1
MTEENLNPKVNIGKELSSAREKAGLSIDAVQKDTKIQKKYLVAIENNDFDALPGKFYVRAFVKSFANAVGLDGDKFINQYIPEENTPGEVKSNAQPVENQAPTASRAVRPSAEESSARDDKPKLDMRKYLPIGIIVAIVVVVLVVVGFAVAKTHNDSSSSAPANSKVTVSNDDAKKKTTKKKTTKKNTLKQGETKIEAVKNSPSDFTVATGNATSKLDLAATQTSNAVVKVNGNQVWAGTLTAAMGHSVELPKDTKEVNISLTNAPVSSVKLNDKAIVMSAPAQGQSATQRDMNLKFSDNK